MISESEQCENPNNNFLQEDQLDYDFNEILTKYIRIVQYLHRFTSLSPFTSVSFHVHIVHIQKFLTVVEISTEEPLQVQLKSESFPQETLKMHSGEKSHKSNQCDYASYGAANLNLHLKTHSGEKPNKCNQCDIASSTFNNFVKLGF